MYLQFYLEQLGYLTMPEFLVKYLEAPSLKRLKKIGYFCGMDYASKRIYKFREYISRYDHSLTVSLLIYKLTQDKVMALAGLFHDISTPCFSHVIDYMNGDYEKQESTEAFTRVIMEKDEYLQKCLKEDHITLAAISDFKRYSIVDNDRPKLCADRMDGIILTGIGWTKNLDKKDIKNIVADMFIFKNEKNEDEIGFKTMEIAKKVLEVSRSIDIYCHSKEDNYMMQLLAEITKLAIDEKYISYNDLYIYDEERIFSLYKKIHDNHLKKLLFKFENIKKEEIPILELPKIKNRNINPIVSGVRIL